MSTRPVTGRVGTGGSAAPSGVRVLVGAAHAGPALAVTVLAGLLCVAQGLDPTTTTVLVAAVLAGQLSIGWSNDLVDAARDRAVGAGRQAAGHRRGSVALVRAACAVAVVACVVLSLALGTAAGLVHWVRRRRLGLQPRAQGDGVVVGALRRRRSAGSPPSSPSPTARHRPGGGRWVRRSSGVGAHLLNVLPDLADDAATGVRGLPHRLGPRRIAPVAAVVLVMASAVVLVGAAPPLAATVAVAVVVLACAVAGRGARTVPFVAAVGIALVDALLLVVAR